MRQLFVLPEIPQEEITTPENLSPADRAVLADMLLACAGEVRRIPARASFGLLFRPDEFNIVGASVPEESPTIRRVTYVTSPKAAKLDAVRTFMYDMGPEGQAIKYHDGSFPVRELPTWLNFGQHLADSLIRMTRLTNGMPSASVTNDFGKFNLRVTLELPDDKATISQQVNRNY